MERVTNDLELKMISGFTSKYGLNKLMYFEQFQYVNEAIKREKQLKNWNRQWKIDLIEKTNQNWIDIVNRLEILMDSAS